MCKRLNRASGVRIPLSPPEFMLSMVAPQAPRDARSKIPPGPEGSNGIEAIDGLAGELNKAGGADYLHTLTSIVPTAANAGCLRS